MSESKVFIIAEAGVNHNGSLENAKLLVKAAVDAGADAVKFQSFIAESLVTADAPQADYQTRNTNQSQSQYAMLKALELSFEDQLTLAKFCNDCGIEFMSTAFDIASLKFLHDEVKVKRIKIGSGELTNLPFIWQHAKYHLPIILSTGMSDVEEIRLAVSAAALGYCTPDKAPSLQDCAKIYTIKENQAVLRNKLTVLHCTSSYPAALMDIHLKAMNTLSDLFNLSVGYSDHSQGIVIPIAAAARGATVIEKHLTLDCALPGPDHKASLMPTQFKQMVDNIRQVEIALGEAIKQPVVAEDNIKSVARKSIVALKNIQAGEVFSAKNIGIMRPGTGLSPKYFWDLLTTQANKDYTSGDLIEESV